MRGRRERRESDFAHFLKSLPFSNRIVSNFDSIVTRYKYANHMSSNGLNRTGRRDGIDETNFEKLEKLSFYSFLDSLLRMDAQ